MSKLHKLREFCRYQSFRESLRAFVQRISFAPIWYFSDLELLHCLAKAEQSVASRQLIKSIDVDVNFLQCLTAAWNERRKGTTGYFPWQMSETCRALVWHALQPSCLIRASSPPSPSSSSPTSWFWSSCSGSVRSPTSAPYRSTSSGTSTPTTGRKGVYDLLYRFSARILPFYDCCLLPQASRKFSQNKQTESVWGHMWFACRPDLIKLSSPMNWGRAKREAQVGDL